VIWYNMYMKTIQLTNGGETIVDDNDYKMLVKWNWQNVGGYASRSVYIKNQNLGKRKNKSVNKLIRMHRIVNNTPEGLYTDHINGNKLDNRKSNLRNCSYSQNSINKPLKKDGVQFRKDRPKSPWRVYVSHNKKEIYVGCFPNYDDAVNIRKTVNEQLNGDFVWDK